MSQEYEEKIQELQKFQPALNKKIEDVRKENDGTVVDNWEKMRIILNKKIIVSMDILKKAEITLKKLEKNSKSPKRQMGGSMQSDRRSSEEKKFIEASNVQNDAKPELQIKEVKKEPNGCEEDNVQIVAISKSSIGEVIIIDDESDDDQPSSKQTMVTNEKPSWATAAEMNDKKPATNIESESTSNEKEILTVIKLPIPLPSFNVPNRLLPLPSKVDEHQAAASRKSETGELSSESSSEDNSEHSSPSSTESYTQEPIDADSMNNPSKTNNRQADIKATLKRSLTEPLDQKSENDNSLSTSAQSQMPPTDNTTQNPLCIESAKTIAPEDVGNYMKTLKLAELPALVPDMLSDVSSSNEDDPDNLGIDEKTAIVTPEKLSESGDVEKVDKNESNIPEERVECENSDANESELFYEYLGDDTATMEELRMSDEQEEKDGYGFEVICSEESKSPRNTYVTIGLSKLAEIPSDQTKDATLSPQSVKDSNLVSDRGTNPCTKSEFAKDEASEEVLKSREGEDITSIPSAEPIVDAKTNEATHTVSVAGATPQSKIHAHATEIVSESFHIPTESSLPQKDTATSTTQFNPAFRKSIEDRNIPLPDLPTSEDESASKTVFQVRHDEELPAQNISDDSFEELSRKVEEIKRELEILKFKETDSESERLQEPRIRKKPLKNAKDISDELNDLSDSDADYLSPSLNEISYVEPGVIFSDKEKQDDIKFEDESPSNVISRLVKLLKQGEKPELDADNLQRTVPVFDLRTYLNAIKSDNAEEVDKSLVKKKNKRRKKHRKRDCLPYRHSSIRFYRENGRSKVFDCKKLDKKDLKLLKCHASLKRSPSDDLDEEHIKFSSYQQVHSDMESVSSSDGINAVNMSPKREHDGNQSRESRARSPYAGSSRRSSQLDELKPVSSRPLGSRSISPRRLKISLPRRVKIPERISRRSKRSPSPRSPRRLSKFPLHFRRTRSPEPKRSRPRSPKPRRSRTRSSKPRRRTLSPKRSRSPGRPRLPRRSRSPKLSRQSLSPQRSKSPRRLRSPRRTRSSRRLRSPTSKQQISPRSLRLRLSRSSEKISVSSSHLSPSRTPPHSICSPHRSVDSFQRSPTHQLSNNLPNLVDSKNDDSSYYNKNLKNYRRSSIKIHVNSDQFQIEKSLAPEKSSPSVDKEKSKVPAVIDLIDLDDDEGKGETTKTENKEQSDNHLPNLTIELSDDEEEILQAPPTPVISLQTHAKEDKAKAIEKGDETIKSKPNADDSSLIILIDDEDEPKKLDPKSRAKQSEAVKIENDPVGDKATSVAESSKTNPADPSASDQPAEASTEAWASKNLNELHEIRVKLEQESGISFQDLLSQMISSKFSKETGYPLVDCAAEFSADSSDQSSDFPDQPMVLIPQVNLVPQHHEQLPGLENISPNDRSLNQFMSKAIPASSPPSTLRLTPPVVLPTASKTSADNSKQSSNAKVDSDLTRSEPGDTNDSYSRKDGDDYVNVKTSLLQQLEEITREEINLFANNLLALKGKSDNTKKAEKKSQDKPKAKKNILKPVNVEKIALSAENAIADLKRRSRNVTMPLEKPAKGKVQRARINRIISSSESEVDDPMDKSFEPKKGSLRKRFTSQVNEFHELGKKSKKSNSKSKPTKVKQAATVPVEQPTNAPEVNLLTPLKEIPYPEKRKRKPEVGTSKRRRRHQTPKNTDIMKHWNYPGRKNCLVCKEKHDNVVYHYANEHRENEVFCARLQEEQVEALKAKPNMVCLIKNANIKKYCGKCVFCSEAMNCSIGRYMEHIASHTGEFAYECNVCGWRWAAKKDISDHLNNECKKGAKLIYVYRYDLSDNMIEACYCTICNYTQLNSANVVKHIRTEHDKQLVTSADFASLTIFKVSESREINGIVVSNETIAEANEPEKIPVSPSDEAAKIGVKPSSPLKQMETESSLVIDVPSEQNPLLSQTDAIPDLFTKIPSKNLQKIHEKTHNRTSSRKMSNTISYPTAVTGETEKLMDHIEELLQALEEPEAPTPPAKSEKPPTKPSPKVLALSNTNIKRVKHIGFEKINDDVLKFYCMIETCEFLTADTVEDLREHMKRHKHKWNLGCNMCKTSNPSKMKYSTIDMEITHLISEHLPSYVTSLLRPWLKESQSLKSKESCVTLTQKFHLENLYKCMGSNCVYTTASSREMQFHVTLTHGDDLTALTCCYCDESFIHSNGLVDHIGKVHGSSIYQCAHCFYRSCAAYNVHLHQRNFHKDQKNPKILVCSGMSYTFNTEVREILDNRQMNIKPSKCPFCRKCVYVKHLLMAHIRKEHPHKESVEVHSSLYDCLYCSYGCQSLQPIRIHMANEHPNRLLYVCGMVFIKSLHPLGRTTVEDGSIDTTSIKSTSLVHIGDLVNKKKFIITDGVTLNFDEESIEAVNSGQGAAKLNSRIRQMFRESALNFSDVEFYMGKIAEGMLPDAIKFEETSELDQLVIAAVKNTGLIGKDLYRCGFPKCNQNFDSFPQFDRHIETHLGNKIEPFYRCPHCTSIIALNRIRLHTIKHRRHRYICYFCAETSPSQNLSIEHMKMKHQSQSNVFVYLTTDKDWTGQLSEKESGIFLTKPRHSTGDVIDTIWNLLRKRFGGKSSYSPITVQQERPQSPIERKEETIIPVFVSNNRFICNLNECTFTAKDDDEFQQHISEGHRNLNSGQDSWSCAHCSYTTPSDQVKLDRIGKHLRFHGPTIAVCNICNFYHYNRENVLRHISVCHPFNFVTMMLHNRSTDAIKTKIEILYYQHIRRAEDSYKCTLCDDQILTEYKDFFFHMRGKHLLNVRFKCDLCTFFENSLEQVEYHSKKWHPKDPSRIRCMFLPACGKWAQNISPFELIIDYSKPNESEDLKEVPTANGNVKKDDANRLPNPVQKTKTSSMAKETAKKNDKSNRKRKHNEERKRGSKSESKKSKSTSDKRPANSSNNDDKKKRQKIKESSKLQSAGSSFTSTISPKNLSNCQEQQPNCKELSTPSVPSILQTILLQSNLPEKKEEKKEEKKFISLVAIDKLMAKAPSSSSETLVTPKMSLTAPVALTTCQSSTTQQNQQQQSAASSCPSLVHQPQKTSVPPPLPTITSIGQQRMPSIPLINQLPTSSTQGHVNSNPSNQPITITAMEQLRGAVTPYQQRPTVPIQQYPISTMEQLSSYQQRPAVPIPPNNTTMEQSRGIMSFSHQQPATFSVAPIQQNSVAPIKQYPISTMEQLPSYQQRPAVPIPPNNTTMEQSRGIMSFSHQQPAAFSVAPIQQNSVAPIKRYPISTMEQLSSYQQRLAVPIPPNNTTMEQSRVIMSFSHQQPVAPIQQNSVAPIKQYPISTVEQLPSYQQRPAVSIPPNNTTMEQSRGIMSFSHQQPATFSVAPIQQNSVAPIKQYPISTVEQLPSYQQRPAVPIPPNNTTMEQLRGIMSFSHQQPATFSVAPIQQNSVAPIKQYPISTVEQLPSYQQRPAVPIPPNNTTMEQSRGIMSFSHQQPATFSVAPIQQNSVAPIKQYPVSTMEQLPSNQQRPAVPTPPNNTTMERSPGIMSFSHQQPATFSVSPIQQNSVAPIQQFERLFIPPTQEVPRFEATCFQECCAQMPSMQWIEQLQRMALAASVEDPLFSSLQPAPINPVDRTIDDVYLSCFHCNGRQDNPTELRGHFHCKHYGEGICFRIMKKLLCGYCSHYASFAELKIHHLNSHPSDIFVSRDARNDTRCAECSEQFNEVEHLKYHTVHHHNKLPMAMYSSFSFLNQRYLEELLQFGESTVIFKCGDCEYLYIDSKSFQDHMINFHNLTPVLENYQRVTNRVIYGCNSCKIFFEAELAAVDHIQRHCALYGCNHCEMNFTSHNKLRNHYNLFHKITEVSYQRRNSQESEKRLMEMLLHFKNGLILSKMEAKNTIYGRHDEFFDMIDRKEKAELRNWIEKQQRTEQIESVARIKHENEANLFQPWIPSSSLPSY